MVLHRVGFVWTAVITAGAVVSYTTISPVSLSCERDVCFCDTIRSHGIWPIRPRFTPGTLPCGVRTFLLVRREANEAAA